MAMSRRQFGVFATVAAAATALAACTDTRKSASSPAKSSAPAAPKSSAAPAPTAPPVPPVEVALYPPDATTSVSPATLANVTVGDGTLAAVTLTGVRWQHGRRPAVG